MQPEKESTAPQKPDATVDGAADCGRETLVLGYGNPARGDDGLGPALIALLEHANLRQVETRIDYQLCVEDAMDIGNFRQVVFVDASRNADKPYEYGPLTEDALPEVLNTHGLSPRALIFLARTLFGAETPAYLLAIRGYEFEPFVESISRKAQENLCQAFDYLVGRLRAGDGVGR